MTKAMRRASRSAPAVSRGEEILAFVTRKPTRRKLVAAAKTGVPPISAISEELREQFSPEIRIPVVKQYVGLCVRAVLEEEGFEVEATGVRLFKDPVFRTGSTYRPIAASPASDVEASDDVLERMMGSLSEAQAIRATLALERSFPGILRRARARRS